MILAGHRYPQIRAPIAFCLNRAHRSLAPAIDPKQNFVKPAGNGKMFKRRQQFLERLFGVARPRINGGEFCVSHAGACLGSRARMNRRE